MSEGVIEGVVLPPGPEPPTEGLPSPPQLTDPAKEKPKRRRSGTANWHMSDEAVDISLRDVYQMTDKDALEYLIRARWGTRTTVRCPHCGTVAGHYWRPKQKRWKCRGCRKAFSVTSKTVFANHKLPLQDLIAGTLLFVNSSGGQPALELKRHWNTTYNTAYTLQHKIREALVRGYNVGLLAGDLEMDGAHQSGHRSVERRGEPQGKGRNKDMSDADAQIMLMTGSDKASRQKQKKANPGAFHPEFRSRQYSADRRIVLSVRKRSGVRRAGAIETRVAVGLAEDEEAIRAVMDDFVACSESYLNTDESPVYAHLNEKFIAHRAVKHTETFCGPNGENNNLAEELNARMDRAEKGTYLNIEPKYLLDYAVEVAFRCDTRRMSNGKQLKLALNIALNVGVSKYWRGFSQGVHRTHELVHPRPRLARASGPQKGRSPISSANGRAPR